MNEQKNAFWILLAGLGTVMNLAACSAPVKPDTVSGHLNATREKPVVVGDIPAHVSHSIALAKTQVRPAQQTFSVVVNKVPARDLLFALGRDAALNVDIHPGIEGEVSMNAIDQTLPQLLNRLTRQLDIRYELDGRNLVILPDTPYLKNYRIDYVNMARTVSGSVATNTQISTTPVAGGGGNSAGGASAGSISSTRIDNVSKNSFWESLDRNIKEILWETDKVLPEGSSETTVEHSNNENRVGSFPVVSGLPAKTGKQAALQAIPGGNASTQSAGNSVIRRNTFREAAAVIIHPESGTLSIRATGRQHERIHAFLERVMKSARRQVMIEATIVEVELSDGYRQGIDWSRYRADNSGFAITRPSSGSISDSSNSAFNLVINRLNSPLNLVAAVDLLKTFGNARVLSSPRLSVLNNQTALLKVVENIVYFDVKSDTTTSANVGTTVAVTTTPQSVSVGLVMAVTPQVSDTQHVILNIRPTISSVSDWKQDPNPINKVANFVPQIRTREIESVMRIATGDIAVLGGLMEDAATYQTDRLPILGQIPVAGELVTKRDNARRKSELVIFLRPTVIHDASLSGDYALLRPHLPGESFFTPPAESIPFGLPSLQ
jgi:MSHA type pilus biogenesis protein MshL